MIVDAIVLAGGRAKRLGGVNKPELVVGDRSLLDRALQAAAMVTARTTVVVGPTKAPHGVLTTVEEPPFGGPVAGLAAGLDLLPPDGEWILVLASDVPRAPEAVHVVMTELRGRLDNDLDGVCLADRAGRPQWLLAVYRRSALVDALAALDDIRGVSFRRLVGGMNLACVVDDRGVSDDVDSWEDVERARSVADSQHTSRSGAHRP